MLTLMLDKDCDSLLRQMAADLQMTREELATVVLESSVILSTTR